MSWYRSNDNRKVVVYIVYTWYMRISYFKNRGIILKIKKSNSIFKYLARKVLRFAQVRDERGTCKLSV